MAAWTLCATSLSLLGLAPIAAGLGGAGWWRHGVLAAGGVGAALLGGLLVSRRPGDRYGWLWLAFALAFSVLAVGRSYAEDAVASDVLNGAGGPAIIAGVGWATAFALVPALMLLFRDGRLPSRRWRPVAWASVAAWAVCLLAAPFAPGESGFAPIANPLAVDGTLGSVTSALVVAGVLVIFACVLLSALSLVLRYRTANGIQRQQIKWLAYAAVVFGASVVVFSGLLGRDLPGAWDALLETVAFNLLCAAVGMAVLRHRLYDIDLIVNRTLIYGVLTASIVGLYVLVVGLLGTAFRAEDDLIVSLVGAGVVAVVFSPLRERLHRAVNRLMYGERDDPYGVLSRLGQRLEDSLAPEAVLPAIVDAVAKARRLRWVGIWLVDGDDLRLAAAHGPVPARPAACGPQAVEEIRGPRDERPPSGQDAGVHRGLLAQYGADLVLPLAHRGELVGVLAVAAPTSGDRLSQADRRLLRDLAAQAAAAVHAAALTAALSANRDELKHSRERLVAAQDEERRRLQRDLHDGLGPVLASMRLRLEACLEATGAGDPSLSRDLEATYDLVGQATREVRNHPRPPAVCTRPTRPRAGSAPALRPLRPRDRRRSSLVSGGLTQGAGRRGGGAIPDSSGGARQRRPARARVVRRRALGPQRRIDHARRPRRRKRLRAGGSWRQRRWNRDRQHARADGSARRDNASRQPPQAGVHIRVPLAQEEQ